MNKNKDYWKKRALLNDKQAFKDESKLLKSIYEVYHDAFIESVNDLNSFYMKYANENGLTYLQAKKSLNPIELKECTKRIEKLHKLYEKYGYEQIKLEIKKLQGRGTITRLQSLVDGINIRFIESASEYDYQLSKQLETMYKREYKDILKEAGVKNATIPKNSVKVAMSHPWSGSLFSERIWKNKDSLISFIKQDLTKGMIKGTDIRKLSKQLSEREKVTKYEAERLCRTESCYIRTRGDIDAYKDSKVVEGVEILTAGDGRVCPTCSTKDGVFVALKDAVEGDTIPPFHPGCRCCPLPSVE